MITNMKNTIKLFYLVLVAALAAMQSAHAQLNDAGTDEQRLEHSQVKDSLALQGYDPVSYFQGTAAKGSADQKTTYKGLEFQFVSEENRLEFETNPSKYDPAYGGWCGYMLFRGKRVQPNPENFIIHNGKLVLFFEGMFGDGQKLWFKAIDKVGEGPMIKQADDHWVAYLEK